MAGNHQIWAKFVEYFRKRHGREPSLASTEDVAKWQAFQAGAEAVTPTESKPQQPTFVTNPKPKE